MSYSCYISFKEMPADNIQDFLITLQAEAQEKMQEIAKDNYSYVPYIRRDAFLRVTEDMDIADWCAIPKNERKKLFPRRFTMTSRNDQEIALAWAQKLFQYRTYYDKERKLLCMFGMPDALEHLFDGTVYFQNSCDQDYDRESYKGIAPLEAIWDKWNNISEEALKWHETKYGRFASCPKDERAKEIGYAKRTAAYEEIFETNYEKLLYGEKPAIYINLFAPYERNTLMSFIAKCHEEHVRRSDENDIEVFEALLGLRPTALALIQKFSKTPVDCVSEIKSFLACHPHFLEEHQEYQETYEKMMGYMVQYE